MILALNTTPAESDRQYIFESVNALEYEINKKGLLQESDYRYFFNNTTLF